MRIFHEDLSRYYYFVWWIVLHVSLNNVQNLRLIVWTIDAISESTRRTSTSLFYFSLRFDTTFVSHIYCYISFLFIWNRSTFNCRKLEFLKISGQLPPSVFAFLPLQSAWVCFSARVAFGCRPAASFYMCCDGLNFCEAGIWRTTILTEVWT